MINVKYRYKSFVVIFFCNIVWNAYGLGQPKDTQVKKEVAPVKTHNKNEDLGWHYYWDDEEAKEKEEEKIVPPVAQPTSFKKLIKPFSTEWFKENFEIIQQTAIDSPTKTNMKALLYAERVMADKSEVFARQKQFVQSVDPMLQEGTRIPMAGAAKNLLMTYKAEQKEEALLEVNKHVGIGFFYDGSCGYCQRMIPVINLLKDKSGIDVRVFVKNTPKNYIPGLSNNIPVYPDKGISSTFEVTFWPAVVMLRPPEDVYVIAQGSLTLQELTTRIVNIAFDQNILNEEWYNRVYPEQQGLLSPEQLADLPNFDADDPVSLINAVVELLESPQGTYQLKDDKNEKL
ncbi:conjugal transfer protein TraF [Thalassotalea piscium]|uniref:Conjugal transfer pilus assembly protein TraF n=1 Tax=Thalassotalea piscium TaxID=1230533 RepID=A0A7X0TV64_9GAMM|nr:conjugal transfer pilus assembly protein TraF [Thalassotalea piscium]